jgi:predicted dehydrogenase
MGVMGATAMIAAERVIPAMLEAERSEIVAVASRDPAQARDVADRFGIARVHASYEALLADPDIEVVYLPLPNHLHLQWTIAAIEPGKHVLCEKPMALNAGEVRLMIAARDKAVVLVEEAFMLRSHPQWSKMREIIRSGRLGKIQATQGLYTYFNRDPNDIRNRDPELGGGGTYDLGCYTTAVSRYIFQAEPIRVIAAMQKDPSFGTDRLSSVILEFPDGHGTWTISTQSARYQGLTILGEKGWMRPEIPHVPFAENETRIFIAGDTWPGPFPEETITLAAVNQYTLQGDRFSRLVLGEVAEAWPLETALANIKVLDALFGSQMSGCWEMV